MNNINSILDKLLLFRDKIKYIDVILLHIFLFYIKIFHIIMKKKKKYIYIYIYLLIYNNNNSCYIPRTLFLLKI